jgi:phosphoribosylformylglycinamidine cyclo-ligase
VPALFQWLQRSGDVPDQDMLRAFNMGIGLIIVCTPALADTVMDDLRSRRESPVVIGEITRGERVVTYS